MKLGVFRQEHYVADLHIDRTASPLLVDDYQVVLNLESCEAVADLVKGRAA